MVIMGHFFWVEIFATETLKINDTKQFSREENRINNTGTFDKLFKWSNLAGL